MKYIGIYFSVERLLSCVCTCINISAKIIKKKIQFNGLALQYGIQIYDHKLYFVLIKKNSQSYISEARPQYIKLHGHSPYYTINKNMGDNL